MFDLISFIFLTLTFSNWKKRKTNLWLLLLHFELTNCKQYVVVVCYFFHNFFFVCFVHFTSYSIRCISVFPFTNFSLATKKKTMKGTVFVCNTICALTKIRNLIVFIVVHRLSQWYAFEFFKKKFSRYIRNQMHWQMFKMIFFLLEKSEMYRHL